MRSYPPRSSLRRFASSRIGSTWGLPMVSKSDAAIVRSLLRKSQSLTLQLADDAANMGITAAKRMRPKDSAQKIKLLHCYVTVAIRYMVETQS